MRNRKIETIKEALATTLFGVSLISVAYAQPAAQPAKTTGNVIVNGKPIAIDKAYADKLITVRKRGVPLYFPTYIPARFALSLVKLDADYDQQHPDYKMEFKDKNNHGLAIESAFGGIGDGPDGDRQLTGTSKIFGGFRIDVFKPGSEGNCTKQIYYLSSWMSNKQAADAQKKVLAPKDARYYHFLGEGVTDKEAIEIVQSLQPVSDVR
jgi:hypothetical protein